MKKLILVLLSIVLGESTIAQNKLGISGPFGYTERKIAFYRGNPSCFNANVNWRVKVNGTLFTNWTQLFAACGGDCFRAIEVPFGVLQPGDVVRVEDNCGSVPYETTVQDDYFYLEIPSGPGHSGNGISSTDIDGPGKRLLTPLNIGKCSPLTLGAHALINYTVRANPPGTATNGSTGTFKINGVPLASSMVNPIRYNSYDPTFYQINANGSINTDDKGVALKSVERYSGTTPLTVEYVHDGQNADETGFAIGTFTIRRITNSQLIFEYNSFLTGNQVLTINQNLTNSTIKMTYDGSFYKLFIDGVEKFSYARTVQYTAKHGTISNTNIQPYGSSATYTPTQSGPDEITTYIDDAVYVTQLISVAQDLSIAETVTNVACFGGSTGKIKLTVAGGVPGYSYSKDGVSYQTTNEFTGLAAGNYTITVKDGSGCTTSKVVAIGQNPNISLSASTSNANCILSADGSITLNASGGFGAFQYGIANADYQASNILSSKTTGTYDVWVKDAAGCTKNTSATIGSNSTLSGSVSSFTNISCFGGNNGSINIASSGVSSGPIQYSINNGTSYGSAASFTGLTANNYQVVIKDNLCTVPIATQNLSQPSDISISLSPTNVRCFGGNDGQVSVSASGGSGPSYTYSADNIAFNTLSTFSSLAPNTYKFWVRDANLCVKESGTATITQPTDIVLNVASKSDITCFGLNNGMVNLSTTGGTSPFQYQISTGAFGSSTTFTSLGPGSKTFTVKDANACTKNIITSILEPTDIIIGTPTITNLLCNADNTGKIVVSAGGGTGILEYSINATSYQPTGTFNALSAQTYTITTRDANLCTRTKTALVTEPTVLGSTPTVTANLCHGDATGKISMAGTGGTAAYLYAKDGINFQTTGLFENLVSGSFSITTKDANGCLNNQTIAVGQPTVLTVSSVLGQDVKCFGGNDGTVLINAAGATPAYRYSKDGTNYQTANRFSFAVGTYGFWVKDANNCIKTTNTVTVGQPAILVPSIASKTEVSCFGGNNASVTLSATGGPSTIYMYSKDNGSNYQSAATFSGFSVGNQSFLVKDANGCTKPISATFTQPSAPLSILVNSQSNLTCFENNSGAIQTTISGGTSPYQYTKDNTNWQTNGSFAGLSANTYTIYGKDAKDCPVQSIPISLTQPSNIVFSLLMKDDVNCETNANGQFKVGANGGTGGLTFAMSGVDFNGNSLPGAANTLGLFANLKAGNYNIRATDQNACPMDFPVTIISKNAAIRFDIAKTLPTDCAANNGTIGLTNVRGGSAPYTYSISTANSGQSGPVFSNLINGSYIINVSDALCSYAQTVDLTLPNSIKADAVITPISCLVPNGNLSIQNLSGGNGNYTFALDGVNFSSTNTFNNLSPEIYAVTIKDSPLSCQSVVSVELKEQNRADLKTSSITNILCFGANTGAIVALADNTVGPFQYALNSGGYGPNPNFGGLTAGNYKISALNRIGCVDSIRVNLTQPTAVTLATVETNNLCFADLSGKISALAGGGVSPYQYQINGGAFQSSTVFSNLTAGTYSISTKDQNNCTLTLTKTLTQPGLLVANESLVQNVSCFAGSDAQIKIEGTGGTQPYVFSKDAAIYQNANQFNDLPIGTYTLTIKDANGCIKNASPITVMQPTLLVPSIASYTDALCFGGSDGTITLAAAGGTLPYQYSKNNLAYQVSTKLDSFPAGTFTVYVKDAKGCVKTINQAIDHPAPLTLDLVRRSDLTCFQNQTGIIEVGITGGKTPYRYSLNNAAFQPSPIFNNLTSGSYSIVGKDANNCTFNLNTRLTEPELLEATYITNKNKCFGDETGRLFMTPNGGTQPYAYSIGQGFYSGGEFVQLRAGNYSGKIVDRNGCNISLAMTIEQPDDLVLTPIYQDTIACKGNRNGVIRIDTRGGTPGFLYSIDNQIFEPNNEFKNLKADTYNLFVKDANACFKQTQLKISEPDSLLLKTIVVADPLCIGDKNGKINVVATGGNGRYLFMRDNLVSTQNSSGNFMDLTEAEYTFKVVDRKACAYVIPKVTLKWPKPLSTSVQVLQPRCFGDANASIALKTSGGHGPYKLGLNAADSLYFTDSLKIENLKAGFFSFQIKDTKGCVQQVASQIAEAEPILPISFADLPKEVCQGQEVELRSNNNDSSLLKTWYLNDKPIETNQALKPGDPKISEKENVLTTSKTGIYKLVVKNNTGCSLSGSYALINNKNALKVDFLMAVQAFTGDSVVVLDQTSPQAGELIWELPPSAKQLTNSFRKMSFILENTGMYNIKLTAKKNECLNTKTRQIEIFAKENIGNTNPDLFYNETDLIKKMTVSPNPNYGTFKVEVELKTATKVELFVNQSSNAALVYKDTKEGAATYTFEISLKNFLQGQYLISINAGKSSQSQRVLIMN